MHDIPPAFLFMSCRVTTIRVLVLVAVARITVKTFKHFSYIRRVAESSRFKILLLYISIL